MTLEQFIPEEHARVVAAATATATALAAIATEMHTVLTEGRHAPGMSATVLAADAKRAALAVASLASHAGKLETLVRLGAP